MPCFYDKFLSGKKEKAHCLRLLSLNIFFWGGKSSGGLKIARESSAAREKAFDLKPAFVAVHDVLDDRETEPRSPALAAAFDINPVKAFGQAGQVRPLDAGAEITDLNVDEVVSRHAKTARDLFCAIA